MYTPRQTTWTHIFYSNSAELLSQVTKKFFTTTSSPYYYHFHYHYYCYYIIIIIIIIRSCWGLFGKVFHILWKRKTYNITVAVVHLCCTYVCFIAQQASNDNNITFRAITKRATSRVIIHNIIIILLCITVFK